MTTPTLEFLRALPKAELHCHLDGSMRHATVVEGARGNPALGISAANDDELRAELGLGKRHDNLVEYLKVFDITLSFLQDEAGLRRAVKELVQDAAAENLRHLEVRYAPELHTRAALNMAQVHDIVSHALAEEAAAANITAAVIVCGMRLFSPESTVMEASLASMAKETLPTAFDIAGPEDGFPPSMHEAAFKLAKRNGLCITCHAGEAAGADSVWDAIVQGRADRIGHGVRMMDDPALLNYVADHQIPVEICLISNLQTSAVETLADHPLPRFLEAGVCATLCTDNRLVSDTTVTDEYRSAVETFGFGHKEVMQLAYNGFKAAFLPLAVKRDVLARVRRELEELAAAHNVPATDLPLW